MGFVVKSAFWLGVVYSAMPFNSQSSDASRPLASAPRPEGGVSLKPYSEAVNAAWREREDLAALVKAAAALCGRDCPLPPARWRPGG